MRKIFTIIAIVMAMVISSTASAKVRIPLKHTTDTDSEYVVFANGISSNMNTAKIIAQNECYGQLARNLDSRVKTAIKTYANNYQIKSKKKILIDDGAVTETITTTLSNTRISKVRIVETKVEQKKVNGQRVYVYWVSMSMPKEKVNDVVIQSVVDSNIDEVTKSVILNDRDNFERSINEEFENFK